MSEYHIESGNCTYRDDPWIRMVRRLPPSPDPAFSISACVRYLNDLIWDRLIHEIVNGPA